MGENDLSQFPNFILQTILVQSGYTHSAQTFFLFLQVSNVRLVTSRCERNQLFDFFLPYLFQSIVYLGRSKLTREKLSFNYLQIPTTRNRSHARPKFAINIVSSVQLDLGACTIQVVRTLLYTDVESGTSDTCHLLAESVRQSNVTVDLI